MAEEYSLGNEEYCKDDERVMRILLRRIRAAWTEFGYYLAEVENRLKDPDIVAQRDEITSDLELDADEPYNPNADLDEQRTGRHIGRSIEDRQKAQKASDAEVKGYAFSKTPTGDVSYTAHVLQVSPLCKRRYYGGDH